MFAQVREAIDRLGFDFDLLGMEGTSFVSECNLEVHVTAPQGNALPTIAGPSRGRQKSWLLNYSVISFLMNGQNMTGSATCLAFHTVVKNAGKI